MNKNRIPVLSVVLYTIAGVLMLYTIWSLIHSVGYISELIDQGQLTAKGNGYDIVNFFMSGSVQYALFAVILFTLGWMLHKSSTEKIAASAQTMPIKKHDEDDFDDWFKSNQN